MNFLVTGGAGFIGSHVCERLLRDGHRVWAFDDLNDFYDPQIKRQNLREIQSLARPFEFIHGDITDAAALAELFSSVKFDQIIHLAARAGVRPSLEQPALYQRVNVEGTVNLLEAARKTRRKKNHPRVVVVRLWRERQGAVQRERPDFFRHLALRRQQARVRGARPRLSSHLQNGRGGAALFHGLWPAPAAGSGHPQIHEAD